MQMSHAEWAWLGSQLAPPIPWKNFISFQHRTTCWKKIISLQNYLTLKYFISHWNYLISRCNHRLKLQCGVTNTRACALRTAWHSLPSYQAGIMEWQGFLLSWLQKIPGLSRTPEVFSQDPLISQQCLNIVTNSRSREHCKLPRKVWGNDLAATSLLAYLQPR